MVNLIITEFSLLEWRSKYDLSLDGALPSKYANILLAYLGVSRYLQETCTVGTAWQNGKFVVEMTGKPAVSIFTEYPDQTVHCWAGLCYIL